MAWKLEPAVTTFERFRSIWDELNLINGNHILLDSIFVGGLLRHFATPETVLAISEDPARPGMALLERVRPGFIQTFQPSQAPVGLFLLGKNEDVLAQVEDLLSSLPPYVLGLSVLQQDPSFSTLSRIPPSPYVGQVVYIETARVTLRESFESYWKSRPKNLVDDLARQRRKLAREGKHLEFVIERAPDRIGQCVNEYGHLELSGWKGREGTAVAPGNAQGAFYREILEEFCKRREGVVYRLMIDGKTVACELCIERDTMLVDLKTAYDERYKGLSLGSLLEEEMLRSYHHDRYLERVEFYGRVSDWTRRWADEFRPIYHYNFYRYRWVAKLHAWRRRKAGAETKSATA